MILDIHIPDSIKQDKRITDSFKDFLQKMANRRSVGACRYGDISKAGKYFSRMQDEVKAYKKTGNMEQLLNIAVYTFLESYAPENPKFHHNPLADSVTRKKYKLEKT